MQYKLKIMQYKWIIVYNTHELFTNTIYTIQMKKKYTIQIKFIQWNYKNIELKWKSFNANGNFLEYKWKLYNTNGKLYNSNERYRIQIKNYTTQNENFYNINGKIKYCNVWHVILVYLLYRCPLSLCPLPYF